MRRWGFVIVDPDGPRPRNDALFDAWSLVHLVTGAGLAWVVHPVLVWFVLALWEPLEIFVVCPLVYRFTGREFGYESLRNSVSDIVFNTLGVFVGYWILRGFIEPHWILI